MPGAAGGTLRPLLDINVEQVDDVRVRCLVDSGSLNTLFPAWVARGAGVSLARAKRRRLGVGGTAFDAQFTTVTLAAAGLTWDAPVGFCDPWPYAWGLLGQESFFRYFAVTFRAADGEMELIPVSG